MSNETIVSSPLPLEETKQLLADIIAMAKRKGATAAEVAVTKEAGLSVSTRNQDIEVLEFNQDGAFGINLYVGNNKGSASTNDTTLASIEKAVDAAYSIARFTAPDPYAGLADAELMPTELMDLDLYHPTDVSPEVAKQMALAAEAAGLAVPRIIQSEGATLNSHNGVRVYANSHGFVGGYLSSRYSLSCSMIANDSSGMERDYAYTINRCFNELVDPAEIGKQAAQDAVSRLNARQVKTGAYAVLFSAEVASSLWGHLLSAIRGSALYRRSTFLLDKKGEQLFPAWVQLEERPHELRGLGSTCFDNDGVATQRKFIVESGKLDSYLLDAYSARRLGLQTTGNAGGVHNLYAANSGEDYSALVKSLGTGLIVTELMGQGVNLITGDYSRGASGYWVENGEIQYPVAGVTVAATLQQMFQGILAVGNDVDIRKNILTGSVLIDKMMVAGS